MSDPVYMEDSELLDFIIRMKRKARRADHGRIKRISYSEDDRQNTLKVIEMVSARGGTIADVAEMLSVNQTTLMGWIDKFTDPESNWHIRDIALRLRSTFGVVQ